MFWKSKSCNHGGRPRLSADTIVLIRQRAKDNVLCGAERIHGELLKLDIKVATATIQKYMGKACPFRTPSQTWLVFLKNHAKDVWACDFLPVIDLFFRQTYFFFIVELASRRIVRFNITAHPADAWVAQQLREATPFGLTLCLLIRDRDGQYRQVFTRVAEGSSIGVLKIPYRAPKMNAVCERFLRSVQRECLDHIRVLAERHLHRVIKGYVEYFDEDRPHQGIGQRSPEGPETVPNKR